MIIIDIDKQGQNGTTIFNIFDNTTELWITKYIIGEIFSSGGATLYKNTSDLTVCYSIKLYPFEFVAYDRRLYLDWEDCNLLKMYAGYVD